MQKGVVCTGTYLNRMTPPSTLSCYSAQLFLSMYFKLSDDKVVLLAVTTLCRLLEPTILQFTETDTLNPVTEHTNCMGAPSFPVMGHKNGEL